MACVLYEISTNINIHVGDKEYFINTFSSQEFKEVVWGGLGGGGDMNQLQYQISHTHKLFLCYVPYQWKNYGVETIFVVQYVFRFYIEEIIGK